MNRRRPRFTACLGVAAALGLLALALESSAAAGGGRAGAPDLSFGSGAKVRTAFCCEDDGYESSANPASASAVAVGPDGKIVVGGLLQGPTGESGLALAGYRRDGRLAFQSQPDFSKMNPYVPPASAVAIDPSGRIVVAGDNPYEPGSCLFGYAKNGALDSHFGSHGVAASPFGSDFGAHAAAIEGNGKILVAGYSYRGKHSGFAIARYMPGGRLDRRFGRRGRVFTPFRSDSGITAVGIEPSGKIVVAGAADGRWALARYTEDGNLDPSFGTDGTVLTGYRTASDGTYSTSSAEIAIQRDGKIILAGPSRAHPWLLARFTTTGAPDRSFGMGGAVPADFGPRGRTTDVAIEPDGKIVAVGGAGGHERWIVARYTARGTLDTSFGWSGVAETRFRHAEASAVAIAPGGKIVVAGDNGEDFVVARYLP